jgi:hypothetical protein
MSSDTIAADQLCSVTVSFRDFAYLLHTVFCLLSRI